MTAPKIIDECKQLWNRNRIVSARATGHIVIERNRMGKNSRIIGYMSIAL